MFKIMVLAVMAYRDAKTGKVRESRRWVNARRVDGTVLVVRGQRRAEKVSKLTSGQTKVVPIPA